MSIWGRAKAKAEELIGRAEEIYGESHGDAAAEVHGEARRIEGEADEEAAERTRRHRTDDDGVSGVH
jgi:uncharacterized protein YjbJ (UPF0337 family)